MSLLGNPHCGICAGWFHRLSTAGGGPRAARGRSWESSRVSPTVASPRWFMPPAALAGYDAREFGGHSLRSGFVTTAGRQGVSLGDAMAPPSGPRSAAVALR